MTVIQKPPNETINEDAEMEHYDTVNEDDRHKMNIMKQLMGMTDKR